MATKKKLLSLKEERSSAREGYPSGAFLKYEKAEKLLRKKYGFR